ncbi:MAG: nucleoside-triphosphatase [Massiliimalia sp.]|jgi:nucleoside-triphosphatase
MKKKQIFLTGQKKSGKSWVLHQLTVQYGLKLCGFQTLPYEIDGVRKGFYFHSLVKTEHWENDVPISVQPNNHSCIPVPHTFETLGVECLKLSLKSPEKYLMMDELGKLEQSALEFQEAAYEAIQGDKIILGVIRKDSIPWLEKLRQQIDGTIYDLDTMDSHQVLKQIAKELNFD